VWRWLAIALAAGTPAAINANVRGLRFESLYNTLFLPAGDALWMCTDPNNAAGTSGCVKDTAGGLLKVPQDVALVGTTLYSET